MKRYLSATLLTAALSIMGGMSRAYAGAIQLTNATELGATDSTFTDPDSAGTHYSGPSVSFNNGDNTLTWSRGSGPFESDIAGVNYANTAFPAGTPILYAGGFSGAGDEGPVTLTFADPVTEFGVDIEEFAFIDYTVQFTVYDGATSLGTFSASGNDPDDLSFEGAAATGNDVITSVIFDDSAAGGENNLGFGPVTYGDAAAPEPAAMALAAIGLAGMALVRRRGRA